MTVRDLTPNVTDCALAFEGGGYREAFSAGVATVLMDAGIRFGYVCGVSAGASNTVDYVSDDKRRVREAFMMHEAAREATGVRSLARGHGYFDADDNPDARYALRQALNAQRTADYKARTYQRAGGVVDPMPDDAPFFVKDYHDYYKTPRGYHPRSLNSTDGWNVTSPLSLLNAKLLAYANEIRSAVLVIHGDKAHSCYFSRDAFARLQGGNKELLLIPGAVHTDLYDRMDIIPFDRIEAFYRQYLK